MNSPYSIGIALFCVVFYLQKARLSNNKTHILLNQPNPGIRWGFFVGRIALLHLPILLFGFWGVCCLSPTLPVTIDSVLVVLGIQRGGLVDERSVLDISAFDDCLNFVP